MKKYSSLVIITLFLATRLVQANEWARENQFQFEAMQENFHTRAAERQAALEALRARLTAMGLDPMPSLAEQAAAGFEEKEFATPQEATRERVRRDLQAIADYRAQQHAQLAAAQQANLEALAQP